MGYWGTLNLRGKTIDSLNKIQEEDNLISKDELIQLALASYKIQKTTDLKVLDDMKRYLNKTVNRIVNRTLKSEQSINAEQLHIVKNTYLFIWKTLNQNFAKPELDLLLSNINLSILRCRVNSWEYQEKQLMGLYDLIEMVKEKQSHEIIQSIRNYLDR